MDEAIAFLQEFTKRELEALISRAGDPDPVFKEKLAAAEEMLVGTNFTLDAGRTENLPPEKLAKMAERDRKRLVQRKILVVQKYQSKGFGELYRAILSDTSVWAKVDYYDLYAVQRRPEGFKIISHYRICPECSGAGEINGKRCINCYGAKWITPRGEQIGDYGTLVETRKLLPPENPVQRADYDAL
jgi:hypothetical protein